MKNSSHLEVEKEPTDDTKYCTRAIVSGIVTWLLIGYVLYGWIIVDGHRVDDIFFALLFSLLGGIISFLIGLYHTFRALFEPWSRCRTAAIFLCVGIIPAVWIVMTLSRFDFWY